MLQRPTQSEIDDRADASETENEDPQDEVILSESNGNVIDLSAWKSRVTQFGEMLENPNGDRLIKKSVYDKIMKTMNELSKRK